MAIAITGAELQQGLKDVQDLIAAAQAKAMNLDADEAVLLDAAKIAEIFFPEIAPLVAAAPFVEGVIALVVAHHTQGRPGSQTPMFGGGGRGNIPGYSGGRIEEDDGA